MRRHINWFAHWQFDIDGGGVVSVGPWMRLRTALWMMFLFGIITFAYFASLQMRGWLGLPEGWSYYCAIIVPALSLLLYGAAVRFAERRHVSELALRRGPFELLIGALVGFAFISTILLLLWSLNLYDVGRGQWRHGFYYFIFMAYISAVLEELAFRGVLLRLFSRMFGPLTGLLVSSVLFAAAHAGHASPIAVSQIFVAGLFLGLLYLESGRLWLSIGAHIGYDFTEWSLMGVGDKDGLLAVSPSHHASALLTGGSFGPDGSVLTTLVGLIFIASIMAIEASRRARRGTGQ